MSTDRAAPAEPILLISANSAWNIVNFRLGLVEGLRKAGFGVVVTAPADGQQSKLEAAGIRFIPLSMSRSGMNPLADLMLVRRYVSTIRAVRPAAYLGFTIKPNIYGTIAARLCGVPTINNVSGLGTMFLAKGWQSRFAHILYRLAFARSQTVFFQNGEDRQLFLDARTVKVSQAKLLPGSGIDLSRFAVAPLPGGPPVFLFIGRLLADKGAREYVAAAKLVRGEVPGARFQLLGASDPGNRTSIPDLEIESWRADGTVELLGETDDVRPFIKAATAVVLPSYREGLPRVLLEASAMGRPSIAADVPGCRAIVRNGENGLLCAARNAGALASAMIAFAELPDERRKVMGETAREIVEREFSHDRIIQSYLQALRDITPAFGVGGG